MSDKKPLGQRISAAQFELEFKASLKGKELLEEERVFLTKTIFENFDNFLDGLTRECEPSFKLEFELSSSWQKVLERIVSRGQASSLFESTGPLPTNILSVIPDTHPSYEDFSDIIKYEQVAVMIRRTYAGDKGPVDYYISALPHLKG